MTGDIDLLIAVYLNQRVVFDLLGMLQGGIATVTKVTDTQRTGTTGSAEIGATFGLSSAIASLLKIDLSAKGARSLEKAAEQSLGEERVHTPASLLFTLRRLLFEKKLLRFATDVESFSPGDMIEFSASLSRNPVVETMDALAEMMALAITFSDEPQRRKGSGSGLSQIEQRKKQIESLTENLRAGDTIDLVTSSSLPSGHRAVVTVERQHLNDPAMADLVDGTFRVLGKIIRAVAKDEGGVSLLRKTALSRLPAPTLEEAFGHLEQLQTQQGFSLPKLTWEIPGPVIHVLPVAIFA